MEVAIYIEGERLDLFESDNISVTQGVQDVRDISKLFADFSQTFSVPASDNNNRIFKHYYNADINNGFDARLRKDGYITVNTIEFKRGKIRLEGVTIENNVPKTYKITFFGDIIKIKDLLGDDKLFDLDWLNNFDHNFDGDTVKNGLLFGLDFTVDSVTYTNAIIYPLISYQRQYLYNSDPADMTSTETLVNIGYDPARTDGVDFANLKPCIKLELVIEAITQKYGLVFDSPFFSSQRFKNIYINLNASVDNIAGGLVVVQDLDDTWVGDNLQLTLNTQYGMTVTPDPGFENTQYRIRLSVNNQEVYFSPTYVTGTNTVFSGASVQFSFDFLLKAEIITETSFEFSAQTIFRRFYISGISLLTQTLTYNFTNQIVSVQTRITDQLKDIKVYDFLTDIFKTFNLVTVAQTNDILVQDLQSWYSEGEIFDITQFIETQTETVDKGKIFREINFKFEPSDQILYDEFTQTNNQGFGDLEFQLTNPDGTPLEDIDGEILDIQVLFENPINERLFDLNTGELTTIQYNPYFNRDIQSISGNPFLTYLDTVSVSANPIGFLNEGVYEQINTRVFMPSHSLEIENDSFNLNFNAEINEYTGIVMPDTIYERFYDDYITDIFSIRRRIYRYKGKLPVNLLHNLKLNDRLIIKNTRYIINKITSNIVNREDDFELINDIYEAPLPSDNLNTSLFRDSFQNFDYGEISFDNTYYGLDDQTAILLDTGFGTGWVFLKNPKTVGTVSNIEYDISENTSNLERNVMVRINDGINNPYFIIRQLGNPSVSFDSDEVTFDNNIISWDNG